MSCTAPSREQIKSYCIFFCVILLQLSKVFATESFHISKQASFKHYKYDSMSNSLGAQMRYVKCLPERVWVCYVRNNTWSSISLKWKLIVLNQHIEKLLMQLDDVSEIRVSRPRCSQKLFRIGSNLCLTLLSSLIVLLTRKQWTF